MKEGLVVGSVLAVVTTARFASSLVYWLLYIKYMAIEGLEVCEPDRRGDLVKINN